MNLLLLQPVVALLGWIAILFAWLTFARTRAVARGEVRYDAFVLGREEPLHVARVTRNLSNQFEVPPLFVACLGLLVGLGEVGLFDVACAWIFVLGRIVHSGVQTLTDDVPLRGRVFMINFLAFLGVAAHLALLAVRPIVGI